MERARHRSLPSHIRLFPLRRGCRREKRPGSEYVLLERLGCEIMTAHQDRKGGGYRLVPHRFAHHTEESFRLGSSQPSGSRRRRRDSHPDHHEMCEPEYLFKIDSWQFLVKNTRLCASLGEEENTPEGSNATKYLASPHWSDRRAPAAMAEGGDSA